MGAEGVVGVLGRAVQDEAPFLQFPLFLRVADLRWHVLDFQGPLPLSLLSPAVYGHEFPVGKPFVGMVQQSLCQKLRLGSRGRNQVYLEVSAAGVGDGDAGHHVLQVAHVLVGVVGTGCGQGAGP